MLQPLSCVCKRQLNHKRDAPGSEVLAIMKVAFFATKPLVVLYKGSGIHFIENVRPLVVLAHNLTLAHTSFRSFGSPWYLRV
jgi:hypothetical protein